MAGNTPFRRWKREVHEGGIADPCILHWPAGIAGRGEIRHQFAHAIDVAPTIFELIGATPPAEIAGVEQTPGPRDQLRAGAARRRRAGDAHHAVLRDARQPRHLPRRLEGGDVQAARRDVRRRHRPRRAVRGRRLGAVPRGRGPHRVRRPRGRAARRSSRRWSTSGGRRRASTTCSRSTTGRSRRCSRPGACWGDRSQYVFHAGRRVDPRERDRERPQPRPHDHRARRRAGGRTAVRRAPRDGDAPRRLVAPPGRRPAAVRAQLARQGAVRGRVGRDRRPRAARARGSSSRAGATSAGPGACSSTAPSSARATSRRPRPSATRSPAPGSRAAGSRARAIGDGYAAPFRFTGTIHDVTVDVSGTGHRDPDAEFEAIMAEQ